ncbi:guanitoxin biosynthesis MATE family efflux transporter GntT [Leptothoe sp. LEGE 181152]|uniref:MATE family efflux transporter n=1 Tax=Adonisia turfae CCMR0081 TaxID=2292702 RepID=A0A6M0RL73_9CYAN|nr:guanitoxin biosynthesis MATE family efflux transporter GntT [Adonisia turfae]MDV3352723.1 guanitoxin biosynthesis MATE family efflux transporter GntT [Leptothoe sp. LEGE 181152]NEZ57007.1 MATE family efflux transporter [Adonisia turfae CCMR0081]
MVSAIPASYKSFLPRFYRLSIVGVFSNMMVPLAGLCDTAFLGHLSDIHYLAGVILGSILFDYLYRILKFLRNSTNALTAQAVGEDDMTGVLVAALRCGLVALAIAAVILLFQYPIHELGFTILSGAPETEQAGITYFNARIWGAPAVLLNFVLIGWFLGREKNGVVFLISLMANGSNVLLDYIMINRWGWESTGAGLATALSQYLGLLVGFIAIVLTIDWTYLGKAMGQVLDRQALSSTLILKGNILVRFLALISAYSIFTNLSATFGTVSLAENGLLLQIALLSQFTVQGVGMTAQTLIGNFKGQGRTDNCVPVLKTAIVTSLVISLGFALSAVIFPNTIFSLLTSHTEVSQAMGSYAAWLVPLLSITSVAFMLEGYFIGLKEGAVLRDGALLGFGIGFIPLASLAVYWHNSYLLWTALTAYMTVLMLFLVYKLVKMPLAEPTTISS